MEASLRSRLTGHLRHHARFYISALLGIVVWGSTGVLAQPLRFPLAGDAFFGLYLVSTAISARTTSTARLRQRASFEDEGIAIIVLITIGVICVSIASIVALLNQRTEPDLLHLAVTISSVLLGWLTFHTIAAFHYAHLYYAKARPDGNKRRDVGGLRFPGTDEPSLWDFVYYSFVVGMTAQVSDVQVESPRMRRVTLVHGIASFFFNAVILAMAVNVVAGQAH